MIREARIIIILASQLINAPQTKLTLVKSIYKTAPKSFFSVVNRTRILVLLSRLYFNQGEITSAIQATSKGTQLFYFSQDSRIINLVFLLFFSYQDNGFNITDSVPLMFLKAVASTKGGLNIFSSFY